MAVACLGKRRDGSTITVPLVSQVVRLIEANSFPHITCILTVPCGDGQGDIVPLPSGEIELRETLR